MIIQSCHIGLSSIPLLKPFKTALRTVVSLESIVIRIMTEDGLVGYGETAPTEAITGDSKETILASLTCISRELEGRDLDDFEACLSSVSLAVAGNYNAKSAAEIALYDLYAQYQGQALYQYLGGSSRYFKTGITISLNPVETMVKDALDAIRNGFDSLKVKLGDDYREDILRVEKIWQTVQGSASLKLDANQGWSPEETVQFLDQITQKGIEVELLEQPVARADLAGLRYIKKRTDVPLLADESVFSPEDARRILEMEAVDLINIKLDKCGGISRALEIADICDIYNVQCMIGCMMEGAISVGAAAHVASARSDTITMLDLDAPILCAYLPVIGGTVFHQAEIRLSEEAGLGIEKVQNVIWI